MKDKEKRKTYMREYMKRRYRENLEARKKQKEYSRKYSSKSYKISEIRKKRKEYQKKYFRNKLKDPEFRKKFNEYQMRLFNENPERREKSRIHRRKYYYRNRKLEILRMGEYYYRMKLLKMKINKDCKEVKNVKKNR